MRWVVSPPSHPPDDAGGLAPWEIELAAGIVAGFVATRPWLREEREDLAQECLLHWLGRRGRHDATRRASPTTYMRRVLEHHLLDIEEKRTAQKRGGGKALSSLDPDEGAALPPVIPATEGSEETALLTAALHRARARLTPDQLALADALGSGFGMTEVARLTLRARSSLYADRQRIQEVFKDEGLDEFL